MAQLQWDHTGRISTNGEYRIGEIVSGTQRTFYLETSPIDAGEVPPGDPRLHVVREQAQALEDGTLDEFEQGRAVAVEDA